MPPKKKQCVSTDENYIETVIQNYLVEQYKPFAINDIVNNLQKDFKISKPNVLKALEKLSSEDKIAFKVFGKVTIYCCKEQPLDLPEGIKAEECTYEVVTELRDKYRALEKERGELLSKLNNLNKDPGNNEILGVIEQLRFDISKTEDQIKSLEVNWDPTNEAKIDFLKSMETSVKKETAKRKKIIANLLAVIKEASAVPKGMSMDEFLVCTHRFLQI